MKLKEIREAYEDTSRTFSSTVRTLAISGIAIGWLFIDKGCQRFIVIVLFFALLLFVLTLFADLIQNWSLSLQWYDYYDTMKVKYHKAEEDEISEPENKNKWGWRFYKVKFWTLIGGYFLIIISFLLYIKQIWN
jgi:Ca2+/Na+ antiporter